MIFTILLFLNKEISTEIMQKGLPHIFEVVLFLIYLIHYLSRKLALHSFLSADKIASMA